MKHSLHWSAPIRLIAGTLLLIGSGVLAGAPAYRDLRTIEPIHGNSAAGEKKATTCFACHGVNGASVAPTFPRLAGQRADYLYQRLLSFKHADPQDPYYSISAMTPNAANLSDEDMRDLATYFASQTTPAQASPAPTGTSAAAATGDGEALFLSGNPARGIPPCQGCHGTAANGPPVSTGPYGAYPALRGQYAPYVVARLTNFRKDLPRDTTNAFIMAGVAHMLDDESMQSIAAWLGSLSPQRNVMSRSDDHGLESIP